MKNYFYSNQIAERIRLILDENLPADTAHNITAGDMSVLPAPDELSAYLPAVIVSSATVENSFANEVKSIFYSVYSFTIYYIFPYTFEGGNDAVRQGKQGAELIANTLLHYRSLDAFSIPKSESEAGGLVVQSELSKIRFDSAEQEIFRALEIPTHTLSIDFRVGFRTYAHERNDY